MNIMCIFPVRQRLTSMLSMMFLLGLIMLTLLSIEDARADDEAMSEVPSSSLPSNVTFSGFGTLGLARSSSPNAEFIRDLSQTSGLKSGNWSGITDSILGLQLNWQVHPDVELVGQVVSKLDYEHSFKPEVMWAFAKWEPDPRMAFRLGRIGADFMMNADSRLVGYSYLPVRPSPDFFSPLFFSRLDGVDASMATPIAEGIVRGKLFAGKMPEKTAGGPGVWDSSGSPLWGAVLDYQTGPWLVRANFARIRFSHDPNDYGMRDLLRQAGQVLNLSQPVAAAQTMVTKDKASNYISLGLVYDEGPLLLQGMWNSIHHESKLFEDSHAAYVLGGYRIKALTPYVGASFWKSHAVQYDTGLPNIPLLAPLIAGYQTYTQNLHEDQHTWTLGTRWDFSRNQALKLQWDAVRGKPNSRFPYARIDGNWNGKTDVLSITYDFVF